MVVSVEELKKIDPAREPQRFYYAWGRRMVTLNTQERSDILGYSAKFKDSSELNAACHFFAEGMVSIYASDYSKAFDCLFQSNDLFVKMDHKGGQMACAIMLCTCYRSIGHLDKAQENVHQALQFMEQVTDQIEDIYGHFKAIAYYQAAEVNAELKNYESSLEFFHIGLSITDGNIVHRGRLLSGIGVVYMNLEKWEDARAHLNEALEALKGEENIVLESKILADTGMFYYHQKEYDRSFEYQEKSLKMRQANKMYSPAITNYIRLAELCLASEKVLEALGYGEIAIEEAKRINLNIKLYEAHLIVSHCYEKLGNVEKAFEHFKMHHRIKDEVHSQDVMRKIEQIKGQHKIESAQQEKEIFRLRNVELKAALNEITESFRYAKRIQTAILPPDGLIKQAFKDSFVLFMPKDIVSGDFYWMNTIEDKVLIAAVDCTGHGVPGAMVSMLGYNALNRTVHAYGLTKPSDVLNKLTVLVEETFAQKNIQAELNGDEVKDGMDMSFACVDLKNKKMQWAGANNPLWICREGQMMEVTADKQPIGKFDHRQPFTNHEIDLKTGDSVYLFTDGFADQFGGPHGKKFKYRQLKDLLVENSGRSAEEQKEILTEKFESWKGKMEQVDDVLLIGIKVD